MSVVAVGVDGSAGSQRALRWAASYARATGARLRAIRAWSYLDQPAERFDPAWGEEQARRGLEEALAALGEELAGVEVDRLLVCDLAAPALLEAAKDADVMVVGSRGLGGFQGLLLGSVSSQVVNHAPCAVVVVPGEERAAA